MKITAPLLRGDGELHIVGSDSVVTFEDPDGAIHRLVGLSDGSRSTTELLTALAPEYPELRLQDVIDAVTQLEAAGLFENCTPRRRMLAERGYDRRRPLALYL